MANATARKGKTAAIEVDATAPLTVETASVETDLQRLRDAYVAAHAIVSAPRYKTAAALKTAITTRLKEMGINKTQHLDLGIIEVKGGTAKDVLSLDLLKEKYPEVFSDRSLWVKEYTSISRTPK